MIAAMLVVVVALGAWYVGNTMNRSFRRDVELAVGEIFRRFVSVDTLQANASLPVFLADSGVAEVVTIARVASRSLGGEVIRIYSGRWLDQAVRRSLAGDTTVVGVLSYDARDSSRLTIDLRAYGEVESSALRLHGLLKLDAGERLIPILRR
jgi:hypothetical protein